MDIWYKWNHVIYSVVTGFFHSMFSRSFMSLSMYHSFLVKHYSAVWLYLTYPFISYWALGLFPLFCCYLMLLWTFVYRLFLWWYVFISWVYSCRMAVSYSYSIFNFLTNFLNFSKLAALFYISTTSVWELQFLQIFATFVIVWFFLFFFWLWPSELK